VQIKACTVGRGVHLGAHAKIVLLRSRRCRFAAPRAGKLEDGMFSATSMAVTACSMREPASSHSVGLSSQRILSVSQRISSALPMAASATGVQDVANSGPTQQT
jgi:hypothetical protein